MVWNIIFHSRLQSLSKMKQAKLLIVLLKSIKNLFHTLSRVNSEGEVEYLGNLLINNMLPAPLTEVDFIDFKRIICNR